MGSICSCLKKEEKSMNDDLLNSIGGRYCFHCNTTFINKKKYNEHLASCDNLRRE